MARKKLLTEGEIRQFMKLANLRPIGKSRLGEMGYPTPPMPGARDEMEMGAEEEVAVDDVGGDEMEMGAEEEIDAAPEGGGEMVSMDDFMAALEQAIEEVTGEEADVSEEPGEEEEEVEMDMEMGPEGGELEMGAEEEIVAEILRRLREDKAYTAKKEKPGEDIRKGAEKRGAEGTKKKTSGKGRGTKKGDDAYVNEEALDERQPRMQTRRDPEHYKPGIGFGEPDPEEEEEEDSYAHGAGAGKGEKPIRYNPKGKRRAPGSQARGFGRMSEEEIVQEVASRVAVRLQGASRKEQMVDHLAERIMKRLTK